MSDLQQAENERVILIEMPDAEGKPVKVVLDEKQARQIVQVCVQHFGWKSLEEARPQLKFTIHGAAVFDTLQPY